MAESIHKIKWHLIVIFASVIAGGILSNITANFLSNPASKLMRLVTGDSLDSTEKRSEEIPKVFYPRLRKAVYNPLFIASRALSDLKSAGDQDRENARKIFLKRADWLKEHLTISDFNGLKYGTWEYDFPFHYYELEPPWRCGMAQGYCISALSKAHEISGDASYLEAARYALNSFFIEVKDGGVIYKDSEDAWWFEEYAGGKTQPRVLNGAIYAVLDVYGFWKYTGDKDAEILYKKGLNGIKKDLEKYDTGSWTYYDAIGTIAALHYHQDHIKLMQKLYDITGETIFQDYARKWSGYNMPFLKREFLIQKPDYHDMVILGLNIGGILLIGYIIMGIILLSRKRRVQ